LTPLFILGLSLGACRSDKASNPTDETPLEDADGDGIADAEDNCPEVENRDQADMDMDELGDACDGDIDGDLVDGSEDCDDWDSAVGGPSTWYADADEDGYGDADDAVEACEDPSDASLAYVSDPHDCDDTSADTSPVGIEVCDGLDNDCDEVEDNDEAVLGDDGCSATSCAAILDGRPTASNGSYYLNLLGDDVEVHCDMTTEGGGWTLVYRATNSGGVAENGLISDSGYLGSTPIEPTSSGHHKLDDDGINAMRTASITNDIMFVIEIAGTELGKVWFPNTCVIDSIYPGTGGDCHDSSTSSSTSTAYTVSDHPGSLSRWYVDSAIGFIWPYTHIGPIDGGLDHTVPSTFCTYYDTRVCPTSSSVEIWVH
jgi:hypothetical protein